MESDIERISVFSFKQRLNAAESPAPAATTTLGADRPARGIVPKSERRAAVLASDRIMELRQIDPLGDSLFLANLCRLFLSELEKQLPRLDAAMARRDIEALEDEAHRIKSMSTTVGATQMSELLWHIEIAARAGIIEEIPDLIEALSKERRLVERAIWQEISVESLRTVGAS